MLSHSVINLTLVSKPVSVFTYKQPFLLLLLFYNLIVNFLFPAELKIQPAALLNKPQKCIQLGHSFPLILASHHAIFVVCLAEGLREDYLVAGLCYS